jgi:hypothetical protein
MIFSLNVLYINVRKVPQAEVNPGTLNGSYRES